MFPQQERSNIRQKPSSHNEPHNRYINYCRCHRFMMIQAYFVEPTHATLPPRKTDLNLCLAGSLLFLLAVAEWDRIIWPRIRWFPMLGTSSWSKDTT